MFEALIDVLKALVAELKRYNDHKAAAPALDTETHVKEVASEKPAAKPAVVKTATKPAAEKPAAKPAAKPIDFASVQQDAIRFSAKYGKEAFAAILNDCEVPIGVGDTKPKVSNAKDDVALLTKLSNAMKEAAATLEAAASDPTA